MQPQVISGSWDEICAQAEKFKGRDDLLLIIPANGKTNEEMDGGPGVLTLAEALKGKTGLVSFEPDDLSRNTGQRFAELLEEEYRAQNR